MTEQYSKFENYKPPFPFNRPYSATILSKFRKAVRLRMLQTIEQYHSKQIIEVDDYKLVAHFHIKESNNKNILTIKKVELRYMACDSCKDCMVVQ